MLLFQSLKISLGAFCYIYGYGQKQIYKDWGVIID